MIAFILKAPSAQQFCDLRPPPHFGYSSFVSNTLRPAIPFSVCFLTYRCNSTAALVYSMQSLTRLSEGNSYIRSLF